MRSRSFVGLGVGALLSVIACAAHRGGGDGRQATVPGPGVQPAADPFSFAEPRCLPSDPACGPIPFGRRSLEKSLYVADWPRISGRGSAHSSVETGACAHDGECFNSGCGYSCLSTRDPHPFWFDCLGLPESERLLRDHYCGCVDRICSWFTQ